MSDIIVIGGGISGVAIALQLAHERHRVTLIERGACLRATSANSLRIIHGGFRYLQSLDLPRLRESLADQTAVLKQYPRFIEPLACLMPLDTWGMKSAAPSFAASKVYWAFMRTAGSPLPSPRVVSGRTLATQVPCLDGHAPNGALLWHDALLTKPAEFGLALVNEANNAGVVIREQCEAHALTRGLGSLSVSLSSGETLAAHVVVNAAGPWIHAFARPAPWQAPAYRWCKGFNIVLKRLIDPAHAIGLQGADGRLFFFVPRNGVTVVGTWYVPLETVQPRPTVTNEEIETFVSAISRAAPYLEIRPADVADVDVGQLPMKSVHSQKGPVLYGAEQLWVRPGYIEVLSTKYTTFRSQALKVAAAVRRMRATG